MCGHQVRWLIRAARLSYLPLPPATQPASLPAAYGGVQAAHPSDFGSRVCVKENTPPRAPCPRCRPGPASTERLCRGLPARSLAMFFCSATRQMAVRGDVSCFLSARARNCHIRLGAFSLDRSSPSSTKRSSGAVLARWRVWGRWVADLARRIQLALWALLVVPPSGATMTAPGARAASPLVCKGIIARYLGGWWPLEGGCTP